MSYKLFLDSDYFYLEQISPHVQCSNCICHGRTKLTISKLLVEKITSTKLLQDCPVLKHELVTLKPPPLPINLPNFGHGSTNRQQQWQDSEREQENTSSLASEHCHTNEVRWQYSSSQKERMVKYSRHYVQ